MGKLIIMQHTVNFLAIAKPALAKSLGEKRWDAKREGDKMYYIQNEE
jgi:hypothetical protein